ncbi:type 1 glutamine amidotransferase domain-containing protein [Flexithrix dorotheae]|uniref:type 1 glutamine amidotransferase domain-containing protein n=1 Tax=Flexithrix dorotheae TaxID=70993 RepID=UPI00036F6FD9|nr:type 1 glutamine amidotransferase domain-containing protein [Flexithrix dorotheae]
MKKVLFVLTSHEDLGNTGKKTGFWIEEFASPYYHLIDNGVNVTLSSPKGGQPPIDPMSNEADYQTPATIRFNEDAELKEALSNTTRLESVNSSDFDAIFFPGGHGPLWDLAENKHSNNLIEDFYQQGKPIGAVCHAPVVFKNAKTEAGHPLVKGKKVTSFSNSEETAMGLDEIVPFLVEDELKKNGGVFSKGDDWQSYAIEDGLLITGQNPASSVMVAQLLLNQLKN